MCECFHITRHAYLPRQTCSSPASSSSSTRASSRTPSPVLSRDNSHVDVTEQRKFSGEIQGLKVDISKAYLITMHGWVKPIQMTQKMLKTKNDTVIGGLMKGQEITSTIKLRVIHHHFPPWQSSWPPDRPWRPPHEPSASLNWEAACGTVWLVARRRCRSRPHGSQLLPEQKVEVGVGVGVEVEVEVGVGV